MRRRRRRAVRVRVVKRGDRDDLVLRWQDPATGRACEQTAGTPRHRDAEREAARLADSLEAGTADGHAISWREFRDRYEREKFSGSGGRPKSLAAWGTAANQLEARAAPRSLDDVDAGMLSRFAADLAGAGRAPATVASYVREIRVALNWAALIWPGYTAPKVKPPRVPKGQRSRGRPVTVEEFERMLAVTERVVGARYARGWRRLLRGLSLSGLRLGEALALTWDDSEALHVHGLDQRRPMLAIRAEAEKGKQDRLLPITPDFAALLRRAPLAARSGFIFRPRLSRGQVQSVSTASHVISAIGRRARVKVGTRRKIDAETNEVQVVPKFASAHDLRRSFGDRWAPRVMPVILKELMRHESIETTLRYYVGLNAERTANEAWRAFEPESGDQIGDGSERGERRKWKRKRPKA